MSTPFSSEWQEEFLSELTKRPGYMTEVRRDGKDDKVISEVIKTEFDRRIAQTEESDENKIELVEGIFTMTWNPFCNLTSFLQVFYLFYKRDVYIGNTEMYKRGDSPVFSFFFLWSSYEMKKIKVA